MKFRRIDPDFEEEKYFIDKHEIKRKYNVEMSRKDYFKRKFEGKDDQEIFNEVKKQIIYGIKWELCQLLTFNQDEQQLLDKIINDGKGLNKNVVSNELNQDIKKIFGEIIPEFIDEFMHGTLKPFEFGLMEQNLLEGPIFDFIRKVKFYFLEIRNMDIESETDGEDNETDNECDEEIDEDNETDNDCDEKMTEICNDESLVCYGLDWKSKKEIERQKIQRYISKANNVLNKEYSWNLYC